MVMGVLNNSPSRRLANHSPREVFMGLKQYNPVHVIYAPHLEHITDIPVTGTAIAQQVINLTEALDVLHKKVDVSTKLVRNSNRRQFLHRHKNNNLFKRMTPQRQAAQQRAQARTPQEVREEEADELLADTDLVVNFQVGDFVMVAIPARTTKHKLDAYWRGPYRVTRTITDYVYEVEHIVTHRTTEAHIARIKSYADPELDCSILLCDHVRQQEATTYDVERIVGWRFNNSTMLHEFAVQWLGFSELENTWQDAEELYEDVPKIVVHYLESLSAKDRKKLENVLNIV
jgi:hypothetical protein